MAFDLVAAGGYGSGEHGDKTGADFTASNCVINWSADVVSVTANQNTSTLTLTNVGSISEGAAEDFGFTVGTEVLIFSIATDTTLAAKVSVGKWAVATIQSITFSDTQFPYNSDTITATVNKNLSELSDVSDCLLRLVNIPHFRNLTLNPGESLVPNGNHDLIAFKCSGTLTFNGGHIDLVNCGLSIQDRTKQRPLLNQENNGTLDTDKYAGWENSATKDRLLINKGDGAAFIIANQIAVTDTASRIGNPNTQGVQFCRGASDSYNVPSGVTNVGGSTILICAGTFTDFTPRLIAKYRTGTATDGKGVGLARCYIASGTLLRNDEGLYAYDNISKPSVVTDTLKIKNFGDGSTGSYSNDREKLWNNFASVTAFSSNRKTLTVTNMTTDGAVAFEPGALVMIHSKNKDSTNTRFTGRFYLAKILGINGNDITLDTAASYNTFYNWLDLYYIQILTIPQFTNFTGPSVNLSAQIPQWSNSKGYGGMLAIACNGTCNLAGKYMHAESKGGGAAYGENGLNYIGNAQDYGRLPVGQGHGSVFILAKNLFMNSATRIGALYSGAVSTGGEYGGDGGFTNMDTSNNIKRDTVNTAVNGGGYCGATGVVVDARKAPGKGGHGGGGGVGGEDDYVHNGGYGSNGYGSGAKTGFQGAHVMIIADTITGFNQAAISTGGRGCYNVVDTSSHTAVTSASYGSDGSAGYGGGGSGSHSKNGMGYGGGGGYNGGGGGGVCRGCTDSYGLGGGGAGWAFVYCNTAVNQDTTDTVAD